MNVKDVRIVDTMARDLAKQQPCTVCLRFESDPHHLISRGAGGHDFDWNLMPLCRECHTAIHKAGLTTYAHKYAQVRDWLIKHNWEFNELLNKWRHA